MLVISAPNMYSETCEPNIALKFDELLYALLAIALEFNVTEVRLLQPEKADSPMVVTLLGMVIEVSPLQPLKADSPILVTLLPMVIEVILLQP